LCLAFKIKIIETAFKGDMQPLVAVATMNGLTKRENNFRFKPNVPLKIKFYAF